jgi:indolepyruvate decarboxylase
LGIFRSIELHLKGVISLPDNKGTSGFQDNSNRKSLGEYLFDCLKEEGITEIFGIPGDYNFSLLDTLERYEGVRFINNINELNAGYAADGYARVKGLGAFITTFGVGEMSACNSVAGAYSENVPVIHIVGSPKSTYQKEKRLLHHTLMDGNYDVFHRMYKNITGYTAVLTPENAELEIPAAIHQAKTQKKPVYLVVAIDLVTKPILRHHPQPPQPSVTKQNKLRAAIQQAEQMLKDAKRAVILVDSKAIRYGLQNKIQELAEMMNVPVATVMQGKSGFNESHPQYIGMYSGAFGDEEIRKTVEGADCIIAVGLTWSDTNSAKSTAQIPSEKLINILPFSVKIGEASYMEVLAEDMLYSIGEIGYHQESLQAEARFNYEGVTESTDDPLSAEAYYPIFQNMLKENDIIIAETGTFAYGMAQVKLPAGAMYIAQGGWQSIGYAVPAAFGACIAAENRRVLIFTGDGSLQLTVQEISSMLKNRCTPIIFILNNHGYTIEKYLNVQTENQKYNQIPNWNYTKLAEAFGGEAHTASVQTSSELNSAIKQAEEQYGNKLSIIELIVKNPMDAPEYLQKMRSYMKKQEG